MATASLRWRSADLEVMPDNGKLYEIIDGELYVSRQPDLEHQMTTGHFLVALHQWSVATGSGVAIFEPGIIFAEDDDVAPDLVWVSHSRLAAIRGTDGKLHAAPELVVEVLSPGAKNERRDREAKLKLYSRQGVHEYWIADWQQRQVQVFRRQNAALHLVTTLFAQDRIESPLLPGFSCPVGKLFPGV